LAGVNNFLGQLVKYDYNIDLGGFSGFGPFESIILQIPTYFLWSFL